MMMVTSQQPVEVSPLRRLQFEIITQFEALCRAGGGREAERKAGELGSLVALYRDFHLFRDAMQPSRAVDFSQTCCQIEEMLEGISSQHGGAFRRALQEAEHMLPDGAAGIPSMPFLSALTMGRLEPSPQAFEAVTHRRFPRHG